MWLHWRDEYESRPSLCAAMAALYDGEVKLTKPRARHSSFSDNSYYVDVMADCSSEANEESVPAKNDATATGLSSRCQAKQSFHHLFRISI
jgi:hypothetical protein